MGRELDVMVAGAGPTGTFLAAEVARRGLSVRIVDQAPVRSPLSRAIVVHARTLEILDAVGVAAPLVARGSALRRIHLRSERRTLLEMGFDDLPTPFPFLLSVPQSITEEVLDAHLAGLGVTIERPARLVSVEQDADGVTAKLEGGETVRARFLVGCDGAHSVVRKALGLTFDGHPYEERLALGDVRWDVDLPRDTVHSYLSADGFLAAFPLPANRWRIIGVRSRPGEDVALDELQAMVFQRTEGGTVSDPTWLAGFRIHARQVTKYRGGRVFLAGDAAHIHSPAGGQGMNLGLQDAHALAWRLAAPTEALLDSYGAERHAIGAATLFGTDMATRMGTAKSAVARAARDLAAPVLASLDVVRRRVVRTLSELDTAVGGSPVVVGDGVRAPHVWRLGSPLRHTAVLPAAPTDGLRARACGAIARDRGLDVVHRDDLTDLVVVRPDGYEGFRGAPEPLALLSWLERST